MNGLNDNTDVMRQYLTQCFVDLCRFRLAPKPGRHCRFQQAERRVEFYCQGFADDRELVPWSGDYRLVRKMGSVIEELKRHVAARTPALYRSRIVETSPDIPTTVAWPEDG